MIARLENLGPFHWFFTLSCADQKWDENFSSLLRDRDIDIEYEVSDSDGSGHTWVNFIQDGIKKKISLRQYLEEEVDESKHELIRTNVLNATRNFQHRVNAFVKHMILGKDNPMKVKDLSYKVEFQGRGAGHIHGVLWSKISSFEVENPDDSDGEDGISKKEPKAKEFEYLTSAFKNLKDGNPLSVWEKADIEKFVDKFVTCSLNPDKLGKFVSNGWELAKLAKEVQTHKHTRTCHKYDNSCRFHKPSLPMKETTLFESRKNNEEIEMEGSQCAENPELLAKVKELMDDKDIISNIMDQYDKENETEEEYKENRGLRIDALLKIAGANYDEYKKAIAHSVTRGHCILLQRDIDEGYINAFNPEWLDAWGGNVDLQPCLDYFAVITYITDYLTKDETGVTAVLKEVMKKNEKEECKERMKMLINTFLTHRQMGQAEAYYKLIPSLKMKYSTVRAIFVPTDKKELRSKFLIKVEKNENTYGKISFNVEGRDGQFIEKADLIDKFVRRPGPKNAHMEFKDTDDNSEELCLVQFAKMMEITQRKPEDDDDLAVDMNEMHMDEDDKKFHYIMVADEKAEKVPLPNVMKLMPRYPGENNVMRKRKFPAAIRLHKKREDVNPHKYFLAELMLYYPFRDEIHDLHSDNEELCAQLYQQQYENIRKVKKQVMEHLDDVEEARYMVEEYIKNIEKNEELAAKLASEREQEVDDCQIEEDEEHPEFGYLDPNDVNDETTKIVKEKVFKQIDVGNLEELKLQTKSLDKYQKYVLEIAINFARGLVKAQNPKNRRPSPPLLMVHGGAGSGKSTVINSVAKWVHHILQKPGDDPNCPYVCISAYTGAAACNVGGQTLHSLFSFNFGSGFMSLSDKSRDMKRTMFSNLSILIIDEISLVDADLLYKIDLRLKEIKQNEQPFGGIALLCFGDLLQIKPVKGRYIFDDPKCDDFQLASCIEKHWHKMQVVNLEENHRQGEDKIYADILNRIRTSNHTEEDMVKLEERVRPKNHKDLKDRDALYLFGKNKPVDEVNTKRIHELSGEEFTVVAQCFHDSMKNFKPPISKTGAINNTPFQAKLELKIGAKIMLTYNVNTADGLVNGSRGKILGMMKNKSEDITKLIIEFENPSHGQIQRETQNITENNYPKGTVIEKISFNFSLSKSKKNVVSTAKVIQFPVKVAFATTAHKIQGQTVKKPKKVVVDLRSVFQPAMAYVMLSRVESIEQLFILEHFDASKIYGNKKAVEELERMNKIAINNWPTDWNNLIEKRERISVLNCGSLRTKIDHVRDDPILMMSDMICLTETWIWPDENTSGFNIEGYAVNHNSQGKGKGVSVYYKLAKYVHVQDVREEKIQLSMLSGIMLDVIIVYRAPHGNDGALRDNLNKLINKKRSTLICGDFNMCFIDNRGSRTTRFLLNNGFKQLVNDATHIDGGHIDQAYLKTECNIPVTIDIYSPYYTAKDHDALCIAMA